MTCDEVEQQIDLYAADECDAGVRAAITRHLDGCLSCATTLAESRRLFALLDLHHQADDGLHRLHQRLAEEAVPRRRPLHVLPFVRRVGSLAAMLLVAVMFSWLPTESSPPRGFPEGLTLTIATGGRAAVPAPGKDDPPEMMMQVEQAKLAFGPRDREDRSYRERLEDAAKEDRLPPPPAIDLSLTVTNDGADAIQLLPGDGATELRFDLHRPGVARFPTSRGPLPAFLTPARVTLAPGASHVVRLNELVEGSVGQLRALYGTEPGNYTLRAVYRVPWREAEGARGGLLTLASSPLSLQIAEP